MIPIKGFLPLASSADTSEAAASTALTTAYLLPSELPYHAAARAGDITLLADGVLLNSNRQKLRVKRASVQAPHIAKPSLPHPPIQHYTKNRMEQLMHFNSYPLPLRIY